MNRPVIAEYKDPIDFVRDMIRFRKSTEPGFTVQVATRTLRRVSPTLVSLILKRKRSLTLDRADEFSKLLNLNTSEKFYFRNWIVGIDDRDSLKAVEAAPENQASRRKDVSTSLLNDWLNAYVKDYFQIPAVSRKPELIKEQLLHVATAKRIEKALNFLLREGYLRRTLDGQIVVETNLAVADTRIPSKKIREFHKGALALARRAIDVFPATERLANTLIIPMDEKAYAELLELIQEFAEKLKDFAARKDGTGDRLYQLIVNVSPIGGKIE